MIQRTPLQVGFIFALMSSTTFAAPPGPTPPPAPGLSTSSSPACVSLVQTYQTQCCANAPANPNPEQTPAVDSSTSKATAYSKQVKSAERGATTLGGIPLYTVSYFDCKLQKSKSITCFDDESDVFNSKYGSASKNEKGEAIFQSSGTNPNVDGTAKNEGIPASADCQAATMNLASDASCFTTEIGKLEALTCAGQAIVVSNEQTFYPSCSSIATLAKLNECIGCPKPETIKLEQGKDASGKTVTTETWQLGEPNPLYQCFGVPDPKKVFTGEKDMLGPIVGSYESSTVEGFVSDSTAKTNQGAPLTVETLTSPANSKKIMPPSLHLEVPMNFVRNTIDHAFIRPGLMGAKDELLSKYGIQCNPTTANCSADTVDFLYNTAKLMNFDLEHTLANIQYKAPSTQQSSAETIPNGQEKSTYSAPIDTSWNTINIPSKHTHGVFSAGPVKFSFGDKIKAIINVPLIVEVKSLNVGRDIQFALKDPNSQTRLNLLPTHDPGRIQASLNYGSTRDQAVAGTLFEKQGPTQALAHTQVLTKLDRMKCELFKINGPYRELTATQGGATGNPASIAPQLPEDLPSMQAGSKHYGKGMNGKILFWRQPYQCQCVDPIDGNNASYCVIDPYVRRQMLDLSLLEAKPENNYLVSCAPSYEKIPTQAPWTSADGSIANGTMSQFNGTHSVSDLGYSQNSDGFFKMAGISPNPSAIEFKKDFDKTVKEFGCNDFLIASNTENKQSTPKGWGLEGRTRLDGGSAVVSIRHDFNSTFSFATGFIFDFEKMWKDYGPFGWLFAWIMQLLFWMLEALLSIAFEAILSAVLLISNDVGLVLDFGQIDTIFHTAIVEQAKAPPQAATAQSTTPENSTLTVGLRRISTSLPNFTSRGEINVGFNQTANACSQDALNHWYDYILIAVKCPLALVYDIISAAIYPLKAVILGLIENFSDWIEWAGKKANGMVESQMVDMQKNNPLPSRILSDTVKHFPLESHTKFEQGDLKISESPALKALLDSKAPLVSVCTLATGGGALCGSTGTCAVPSTSCDLLTWIARDDSNATGNLVTGAHHFSLGAKTHYRSEQANGGTAQNSPPTIAGNYNLKYCALGDSSSTSTLYPGGFTYASWFKSNDWLDIDVTSSATSTPVDWRTQCAFYTDFSLTSIPIESEMTHQSGTINFQITTLPSYRTNHLLNEVFVCQDENHCDPNWHHPSFGLSIDRIDQLVAAKSLQGNSYQAPKYTDFSIRDRALLATCSAIADIEYRIKTSDPTNPNSPLPQWGAYGSIASKGTDETVELIFTSLKNNETALAKQGAAGKALVNFIDKHDASLKSNGQAVKQTLDYCRKIATLYFDNLPQGELIPEYTVSATNTKALCLKSVEVAPETPVLALDGNSGILEVTTGDKNCQMVRVEAILEYQPMTCSPTGLWKVDSKTPKQQLTFGPQNKLSTGVDALGVAKTIPMKYQFQITTGPIQISLAKARGCNPPKALKASSLCTNWIDQKYQGPMGAPINWNAHQSCTPIKPGK